ncbi:MAG TPA: tetratricopeptide repeat protein, partial [Thermoplasmata archaeon]|nr:tetratricopeptide repeat protein [Thermoplasmata archaeon]
LAVVAGKAAAAQEYKPPERSSPAPDADQPPDMSPVALARIGSGPATVKPGGTESAPSPTPPAAPSTSSPAFAHLGPSGASGQHAWAPATPPPQPAAPASQAQPAAPGDFRAELLQRGSAFELIGQTDAALSAYFELVTRAPYNIEAYKRILKFKPNDVAVLERYAKALEKIGMTGDLIEVVGRLVVIEPREEYVERLRALSPDDRRLKAAAAEPTIEEIELAEIVFEHRKRHQEMTAEQIDAFIERLDTGEFTPEELSKVLDHGDYTVDQLFRIADKLFELKKFNHASRVTDRILQEAPADPTTWLYKGSSLFKTGNYEFALQCFDRATRIEPENVTAWLNKGIVLFWMERYDEAIPSFDTVVRLDEHEGGAWFYKACIASTRKDPEKALELLGQAVRLQTTFKKLAKTDASFRGMQEMKEFIKLVAE